MSGTIEQKMLQAIIIVFQTSITAISGLFDYCVFKKCKVDNLEGFLNKFEFKHTLFHLYNNDVFCCKCTCNTKLQGQSQVLKKFEFEKLYKDTGRSHPHIKRNEKGTITQVCICDYEAKPGITLNDLDITLMAKILRNSCIKLVHPTALTGVDEIKERRNRLCHAGSLNSFKESEMDKMLQDLETYVREVIKHVPQTSFQTSIRAQILVLKSSQIQQADAIHIIRETECILEAEKNKLINIIDGNTNKLEVKMESLHQCYKEGTEDLKKTQECHTLQIKQGMHDMEHRVKDDNKTMASDLKRHNDNIKTELKENQEVIKTTQKEHTETLTSIENISGDVLNTTKQTEREQSKQTILIETIQNSVEQLEANGMNEEDKKGLKKINDCINKFKNIGEVLMGNDVGCQTDVESMQFELGKRSKTALECIRAGTDNIQTQNDDLKTTLKELVDTMSTYLTSTQNKPRHEIITSSSDCSETPSPPYDLSALGSSANIINLAWNPPKHGLKSVVYYEIKYKEYNIKDGRWITMTTETNECSSTVTDLKCATEYEFKIRAIAKEGEEGPFSSAIKTSTRISLAKNVQMEAKQISSGHPAIFKLPLVHPKASTNVKSKTRKCIFGKKSQGNKEKTIMLVGATGTGKSTLIDAMINYIIDVSWDDDFRFSLVDPTDDEKNRQNDSELTQTAWMTCYNVCKMDGSKIDYDLNIIDTPGFGDPGEIFRDKAIVDQCCEFLTTLGDQGITCLDAICFVTHAHIERFTTQQRYMFDTILSIFGQDLESNIFVLMTFSDGNVPPVVNALHAAKVPFKNSFKFNNSALVAKSANTEKETFGSLFWKMGLESFRIFFDELQLVDSKSLQLTQEVFLLRKNLKDSIQKLPVQIEEDMNQLNVLRQERQILERHQRNIVPNMNFEYEVDDIRMRKIDLQPGQYATNCLTCNMTCHFPCQLARNENISKCNAMANGNCKVCLRECHWTMHQRAAFHFETYKVKVKKNYQELKQKYETAQEKEMKQRYIHVRDSFLTKEKHVMKIIHDVRGYINKFNEIALRPTPLSDLDYIDLQIDVQKREKGYGWEQRIDLYYNMRKDAQLVANITNFEPWVEDAEDIVN